MANDKNVFTDGNTPVRNTGKRGVFTELLQQFEIFEEGKGRRQEAEGIRLCLACFAFLVSLYKAEVRKERKTHTPLVLGYHKICGTKYRGSSCKEPHI